MKNVDTLPKFSDFVNHDDCIGNITSDLSDQRLEVNKKLIFSTEKMKNSCNCIYDYAHSFSGEDF